MNWVDIVLLVLVAVAAVQGLRAGAAVQVLSYGGFFLGLFLGVLVAPLVGSHVHGSLSTLLVLVIMFALAFVVGGVGRLAGSRSSRLLRRFHLGPLDAALGIMVSVAAILAVAWVLGPWLVNSSITPLAAGVQHSRIVRAIDDVLGPPAPVFSRVQSFLSAEGFPVVFTGLPPLGAGPVTVPPLTSPLVAAAVRSAGPSTVKIEGQGCGVIQEGSGFVVASGLVVTNAHVVAGIAAPQVLTAAGVRYPTVPELFDPELDIAVLRVPGLSAPVLRLDDGPVVARGTTGAVLGYPGGGPFTFGSAGVEDSFRAEGLDIYGRNQTVRTVYQIDAVVRPGNSGGPLVYESADAADPLDNTVIGVVFARSTTNSTVGYALATPAVLSDIQKAELAGGTVSTGACTP